MRIHVYIYIYTYIELLICMYQIDYNTVIKMY